MEAYIFCLVQLTSHFHGSEVPSPDDTHDFALDILGIDQPDHAAVVGFFSVVAEHEDRILFHCERECRPALELCRLEVDLRLVHDVAVDL